MVRETLFKSNTYAKGYDCAKFSKKALYMGLNFLKTTIYCTISINQAVVQFKVAQKFVH
jgi:hypothetical protein